MLPVATPAELSLDQARLERFYDFIDDWVTIHAPGAGAAVLLGRNGRTVEPRYFGHQSYEDDAKPIGRDSMFMLASITKPLTYLCGMMLVERGLLNLSAKVTDYIPEYAANDKGETIVENFFTHTSGLADTLHNNMELRKQHAPQSKFIEDAILTTKLHFPPGTNFKYQSLGTLLVGHLVEKLSGQSLPAFLKENIFDPLGLKNTGLSTVNYDRERIVRFPDDQGNTYTVGGTDYDWNSKYWHEFGAPWGGGFSTVEDFSVISTTMLNKGRHGAKQIVSPATVEAMTTNRLNDFPNMPESVRRTMSWGLGWRLKQTADSWGDLMGPRVFGHTGASGTITWMDPDSGGFFIFFSNTVYDRFKRKFLNLSNMAASVFA